jgi:hypothetical protein
MKPVCLGVVLAACWSGGGAGGTISTERGGTPVEYLERWVAFAPEQRQAPLASYQVPTAKAVDLIKLVPEDKRGDAMEEVLKTAKAYDFDADGTVDLVAFPEIMFGPSNGFVVYVRDGAKARHILSTSGDWAAAVQTAYAVAVRFEANVLAPGEARFSQTLVYERASKSWRPVIKSYAAVQGKTPEPKLLTPFVTAGPATLRATPSVDDRPSHRDEDMDRSAVLRGNALATYAAGARGVVLAEEGEWRYVAFDPATRPGATSLHHGMDHEPEQPSELEAPPVEPAANQLTTKTWLCGWVRATEIR